MANNYGLLIGGTVLAVLALVAFAVYRWRYGGRVPRVKAWITKYLSERYDAPPGRLTIHCADDPPQPVLVGFDNPRSGARHQCRFDCSGGPAGFSLLSETNRSRIGRRADQATAGEDAGGTRPWGPIAVPTTS